MAKSTERFSNRIISFIPMDYMKIAPDEVFVPLTRQSVPIVREYYLVSSYGRVFNKYTGKFLNIQTGTDGYYNLTLSTDLGSKWFRINRLVMLAFHPIPNSDEMVVNHLDCNPKNNHISNLEWTTRTGNAIHAYDNGLMKYGEDGPTAIISKETAFKIAELLQTNMTFQEIADAVGNGATWGIVQNIYHGHGWVRDLKDAGFKFRPMKHKAEKSFRITKEMVHDMCKYFQSNPINYNVETQASYCQNMIEYFNYFGFDMNIVDYKKLSTAIRNIFAGRIHTDVTSQYDYIH